MVIQLEQAKKLLEQVKEERAEAEAKVQQLLAVEAFLLRQIESHEPISPSGPIPVELPTRPNYDNLSLPEAMADVLRRTGRPMHVDRIRDALVAGGREDVAHLKISITTAARRRSDLFVQVARATFALRNGLARA